MHSTLLLYGLALGAMLIIPSSAQAAEAILPVSVTLVKCGETKADIPKACAADSRCCVFMDKAPQTLAGQWLDDINAPTPAAKPEAFIEAAKAPPKPAGAALQNRLIPTRGENDATRTAYHSAHTDGNGTVIE